MSDLSERDKHSSSQHLKLLQLIMKRFVLSTLLAMAIAHAH